MSNKIVIVRVFKADTPESTQIAKQINGVGGVLKPGVIFGVILTQETQILKGLAFMTANEFSWLVDEQNESILEQVDVNKLAMNISFFAKKGIEASVCFNYHTAVPTNGHLYGKAKA